MLRKAVIGFILSLVFVSVARAETLDKQVKCLADNIYYEAANQPTKGKIAVAQVVMNRTKQPNRFGSTPCAVVGQKIGKSYQFSWMRTRGKIKYPEVYAESIDIARNVYYGKDVDVSNGALFYHATYIKNPWHYKKVAQIAGHIFYKG